MKLAWGKLKWLWIAGSAWRKDDLLAASSRKRAAAQTA